MPSLAKRASEVVVVTGGTAGVVRDAAERVERELGPIDVWISNALARSSDRASVRSNGARLARTPSRKTASRSGDGYEGAVT